MSLRVRLLDADTRYSRSLRYAEKPGPLRRLAIFLAHSGDSWFWGLGLLLVWVVGGAATKQLAVQLDRPRLIEFVTQLPRTSTGKLQRYVLRNRG